MPSKPKKSAKRSLKATVGTIILFVGAILTIIQFVTNPGFLNVLKPLGALASVLTELVEIFAVGSVIVLPFWLAYLATRWMKARGKPIWANRIRWGVEGGAEAASIGVLGWGVLNFYQYWTASTAEKATVTSASSLTIGIFASVFGAIAVAVLTYDLYWASQTGEWRMDWREVAKSFLGARQYRTEAVKQFLSLLYQFHTSWVNSWEPKIRLHSLTQKDVDDLSQLNSRLGVARSDMAAESSYPPDELNGTIKQFMKELGELSAFMPSVLQAMPRVSGVGYESTLQTAIDGGNKLAKVVDEITPQLKRAFPLPPETGI